MTSYFFKVTGFIPLLTWLGHSREAELRPEYSIQSLTSCWRGGKSNIQIPKQGYRAVGKFCRSLFKYTRNQILPIHDLPGGFRRRELKRVRIPMEPMMLESLVQPVQRGLQTGRVRALSEDLYGHSRAVTILAQRQWNSLMPHSDQRSNIESSACTASVHA